MRLPRGDAHIAAGVQAPILRGYFLASGNFAQTWHVPVLFLGKRLGHPCTAALLRLDYFSAPEPDDVAEKLDVVWVEHPVGPRNLTKQISGIDEQHLATSWSLHLAFVEEP